MFIDFIFKTAHSEIEWELESRHVPRLCAQPLPMSVSHPEWRSGGAHINKQ